MSVLRERLREVSSFAVVGTVATLTHLVVAWVAHLWGLEPQAANLAGWLTAVGVSFTGQARLTFRVGGALLPYLPRFLAVSGIAWLVSAALVAVATAAELPFGVALALVGVCVPPASYLAQRTIVFGRNAATVDPASTVAVLAGLAVFAWFRAAPVNHDVAWYLVAGRQWIEGARLYTDLSEVNPPLAFYLIRAALHLGDALSLEPAGSLAAFVALTLTLSLGWVAHIVPQRMKWRSGIVFGFAVASVIPFLGHFGQREHLMLVLILPWVAAALFRENPLSGRGAVLRGLVAGVGICLKPHFLVYPLALTLVEITRTRSIRAAVAPGNLAMGLVGLAYLAQVALFHPEYFAVVVPDAQLVYGAVKLPIELQIANLRPLAVAVAALALLALRTLPGGGPACALFVAALVAYGLQGNGFTYHAAPIHALAVIGLVSLARRASRLKAAAALVVAMLVLVPAIFDGGYRNPLTERVAARFNALQIEPESILVWSPSLLPAFPLVLDLEAEWTGHAASLWLLPGTLDLVEKGGGADDPRRAVLERQRDLMARDLERCPEIVVIDRVLPFRDAPLDLLAFAGAETAERFNLGYQIIERGARFDIYQRGDCPKR